MYNNQAELYHHGVKGMRWGVRQKPKKSSSSKNTTKRVKEDDTHEDYKKAHNKKKVKYMSDAELNARISRLQKEQSYKTLSATRMQRGRKAVGDVMVNIGKETAKNFGTKILTGVINTGLKKTASKSDKAAVVLTALNLVTKKKDN